MFLNGCRAVKVNAKPIMWGASKKARLYNIDGDEVWVPRSLSKYDEKEGTLLIEEWFYNRLFENG